MISEHTLAFLWGEEGKGRGGYRISFISLSDNRSNVCYQTTSGPPRILIGETQLHLQDADAVQDGIILILLFALTAMHESFLP